MPRHVKKPKIERPPIKVFHFSVKPHQAGIEGHVPDGVRVKSGAPEKGGSVARSSLCAIHQYLAAKN
jgi:hypothetical protein